MCSAISWSNITVILPNAANSSFNFNATARPSVQPFAMPTLTDPSIFTGEGVLSKQSFPDISALLSAIFIQIAVALI